MAVVRLCLQIDHRPIRVARWLVRFAVLPMVRLRVLPRDRTREWLLRVVAPLIVRCTRVRVVTEKVP